MRSAGETTHRLHAHPDTPVPGARIDVTLARADVRWRLTYRWAGIDPLLPPPDAPLRTDGLWRTTCFELFVRRAGEAGYDEYNFAPSGRWAAYRFTGYRAGMAEHACAAPAIGATAQGLAVTLARDDATPVHIGLCAVIAARDGTKSFWAIAHAPGQPDFHADACFALALPAIGGI